MSPTDEARAAVQRLHALAGGPDVVRLAAARLLARLPPTDATQLLHDVMRLARDGWEPATCVLPAFTRALDTEAAQIPFASALRRVAAVQEQADVEALFLQGSARREYDLDAALRADAKIFNQPLGRLKTQARLTRNPDELSRLAVASNPLVIRNVLINPRLTEEVVVRIAARRPARPEPLVEIWRSARWSVRPMVRRALVFNPYLPPEVGAKIVPLLQTLDLKQLAGDSTVHPSLRAQARLLLDERPAR